MLNSIEREFIGFLAFLAKYRKQGLKPFVDSNEETFWFLAYKASKGSGCFVF